MKTLFISMIFLIPLTLTTNCLGSEDADTAFREALNHEKTIRIFQALDKNREAVRLAPDNVGYLEHYAWLLHNYGFTEEAVSAFEKLRPHLSDPSLVLRGLAWDEKVLGRIEPSANLYHEIYQLKSPKNDYNQLFAEVSAQNVKEQDAKISTLKAKILNDRNNPDPLKELHRAHLYKADWQSAAQVANRLLSSFPADAEFRYTYAKGLAWSGDTDKAETVMKSLITDIPENPFLYYELGKLQNVAGRLDEARESLQQALRLYPESVKTKKELSEVLARLGKPEEASAMAFSIGGDSLDSRLAKARSYHFSGRLEKASPIYESILVSFPGNEDALWGLAETSLYSGKFKNTEKALTSWRAINSSDTKQIALKKELTRLSSPAIGLIGDYYTNSSHYRRINAGFYSRYPLSEGVVPKFGYYHSRFMQSGYDSVNRDSVFVEGGKKITDIFTMYGRADINNYDNDQTHLNGSIFAALQPTASNTITLGYQHLDIIDTEPPFGNPMYSYVVGIGAVGRKIASNDYSLQLLHNLTKEITLWGKFTFGDYSDGNTKLTSVLEADYRPRRLPNLLILYNHFFLGYKKPAATFTGFGASDVAYYDPKHFQAHTIGAEFEHHISSSVTVSIRQTGSYLPEGGGTSTSTFGAISYDLTASDSLRLDARIFYQNRGINRNTNSGHFRAESITLTYNKSF